MSLDLAFIVTAFVALLEVIPVTLAITFVSMLCGFIIGIIVALSNQYNIPVLKQLSAVYVTFIRGTPMITHLLLIYFSLPMLVDYVAQLLHFPFSSVQIPMIVFAYVSFSVTAGAYMSEIIRSGLLSVSKGQLEAAFSVGMSTTQALKRIILPQALVASIPNLSNMLIGMLHGSTLAFTVSVVEINAKAQIIATTSWKFFEAYVAAAIIFWILTLIIERITASIEKRLNHYRFGGVA